VVTRPTRVRWALGLIVAAVAGAPLLLFGAEPAADSVVALQPGMQVRNLSRQVYWVEEGPERLTLQDVIARQGFQRNASEILNPGVSASVIWARVWLRNTGSGVGEWVLDTNRFSMPVCEIYMVRPDATSILFDGDAPSYRASFDRFGTVAAAITLGPGEQAHVYVRYAGSNWSALDLSLYDARAFESSRRTDVALFFLFSAVIAALVLYGSVTFVSFGAPIVLLYVSAQLSFFVFYAHLTGFTTVYLWPQAPASGRVVAPLAFTAFLLAMSQFARLYFETRSRIVTVDRVLAGCGLLSALALVLIPIDYVIPQFNRQVPLLIAYVTGLVCWLVLPGLACYGTWRWSRDYWPLAVAWTSMGAYTVTMILVFTGVVTTIPLGKQSYGVFASLEAACLALALGLRMRTIRAELAASERLLNESLREQLRASDERRRLAEEREVALKDLAEKGRLLLATGHDARQMLFALRSFAAELSVDGTAEHGDTSRAIAGNIGEIVDHLEGILSAAVGAAHSGGIEDTLVCLDTFDFAALVQPLRMIHGARASREGVELGFASSVPTLVGDKVLLLRALSNLIANALDHARATRILVACRPHRGGWRLQVLDNGRGVDQGRLELLTDVRTLTAPGDDGTYGAGAGLSIVKAVAAQLRARLVARSQLGVGSVFELRFCAGRSIAGVKVAVVDGDEAVWAPAHLAATAAAATVEHVSPPLHDRWDVVCLDENLGSPGCGVELVRGELGRARGKVIIATYDRSAEARARLAPDCDLVLYKPLGGLQFRMALNHVLEG
jgi:signal transduction histidine kinase